MWQCVSHMLTLVQSATRLLLDWFNRVGFGGLDVSSGGILLLGVARLKHSRVSLLKTLASIVISYPASYSFVSFAISLIMNIAIVFLKKTVYQ